MRTSKGEGGEFKSISLVTQWFDVNFLYLVFTLYFPSLNQKEMSNPNHEIFKLHRAPLITNSITKINGNDRKSCHFASEINTKNRWSSLGNLSDLGMEHDNLNETLLEKLKTYSLKPNECVEGVRSVAARLHSRAASQDKQVKMKTLERIWQKNQGGLTLILYMLEAVRDPLTAVSLAGILHECVITKTGKNRSPAISQLVHLNATQSLTKQLNALQVKESVPVNDVLIQEIVWTLSQLAQRDSKFSLKTRLLGAVKTFHYFLKAYHNHAKLLYPILLIIKALSRNSNTSSVLARDGIVGTIEKVLSNIGFTPSVKLRLTLNIISYLSKNKICCSRIIQSNILSLILRIFERWERYEGKTKLKICHYSIVTLQRVCYLKHGRKAVRNLSGVSILYKFCQNCPEDKSYDQVLGRVCGVVNFCLERKTLPVEDPNGPAKFVLPNVSNVTLTDKSSSALRDSTPDFDEGDSEDELVEDIEEDGVVQVQGVDPDESKILPQTAEERDLEDLKMYSSLCKEFMETVAEGSESTTPAWKDIQKNKSKSLLSIKKERSKTTLNDIYNKCTFLAIDRGRHLTTNIKFLSKEKLYNLDMRFISSEISLTSKFRNKSTPDDLGKEKKSIESNKKFSSNVTQPKIYSKDDLISLQALRNLHQEHGIRHAYSLIASQVKSVLPFVKVAYPDIMGGEGTGKLEPLNVKDRKVCRQKLLESVEKGFHPTNNMYNVVYDLDNLVSLSKNNPASEKRELYNDDEKKVGEKHSQPHLLFESRFESGNLRKAIQIGSREYELVLNSDVNSDKHHNWFYFEVSNMDNSGPYIFNIVNFEKMNSQFNYGMKPILYSVQEALLGRPGWVRAGIDICYFRNSYQKTTGQQKCYFTTTFSITFQHNYDICYLAYHFPYTYTQLLAQIWKWSCSINYAVTYFRAESLCETLNGNQLPVLTITAVDSKKSEFSDRETMFLSARVHPGESNASWIMLGSLHFLLSSHPQAVSLRNRYVFKIIPMLNIEGVINGCARCGLSNEDLNRRWKNPHPILHPEIYHTKGLLEYCCRVLKKPPFVFCDFHGHSRKKNVFLYGCANSESWSEVDKQQAVSPVEYLLIAHLMKHFCPAFSFSSCKFRVERSRESTARVAVWRDFGIKRSYTMESSYCGCDQGIYAGRHLDTLHLKEIGKQFCEVLACLHDETTWRLELLIESQEAASKFSEVAGSFFPKAGGSDSQSDLLENSDSISNSDDENDNEAEDDD